MLLCLLAELGDGDWLTNLCGLLNLLSGVDLSMSGSEDGIFSCVASDSCGSSLKFESMDRLKNLEERFKRGFFPVKGTFDGRGRIGLSVEASVSVANEPSPSLSSCTRVVVASLSSKVSSIVSKQCKPCFTLKGGLLLSFFGLNSSSSMSSRIKE